MGSTKARSTGSPGRAPRRQIRRLQKRAHITVDGVVGPQTRKALGRFARHRLGTRKLDFGKKGWDVASLQFRLAEHGFPSGNFDGIFGPRIDAALRRFQDWSALKTDGVAGAATLQALAGPPPAIPLPLAWPMTAPVLGDRFGPRGDRWHSGIDLPAPMGAPVYAAESGRVAWAGWRDGGWGFLVVVAHGHWRALDVRAPFAHRRPRRRLDRPEESAPGSSARKRTSRVAPGAISTLSLESAALSAHPVQPHRLREGVAHRRANLGTHRNAQQRSRSLQCFSLFRKCSGGDGSLRWGRRAAIFPLVPRGVQSVRRALIRPAATRFSLGTLVAATVTVRPAWAAMTTTIHIIRTTPAITNCMELRRERYRLSRSEQCESEACGAPASSGSRTFRRSCLELIDPTRDGSLLSPI